jgi:Tfp pilus assembly protein PilV
MHAFSRPNAFSLVEVVLSLGIVVFAGFALIGLLAAGLQSSQDSRERTQAATIAEALCATRRAAPTNDFTVTTSPQPGFPLARLDVATNNLSPLAPVYVTRDGVTNTAANADFGFLYRITPIADSGNPPLTNRVSTVYLCLYWPALASPTNASTGHFELTTTFALP